MRTFPTTIKTTLTLTPTHVHIEEVVMPPKEVTRQELLAAKSTVPNFLMLKNKPFARKLEREVVRLTLRHPMSAPKVVYQERTTL